MTTSIDVDPLQLYDWADGDPELALWLACEAFRLAGGEGRTVTLRHSRRTGRERLEVEHADAGAGLVGVELP